MTFNYQDSFCAANQLAAYERVVQDAMTGDHTRFTWPHGIERLWQISTPVLTGPTPLHTYRQGSRGPEAIHELAAPGHWQLPR